MSKARELADFVSAGNPLSDGAISVAEISDLTASAAELNTMTGITATTSDLNNVAGINTSVQTQLDGKQAVVAGVSSTEIGYLDGVTSALQTQLDNITVTAGTLTKSFASGETASIALSAALSPAPVVAVTKEVAQAGISSKGAWDVNATASNYELHNTAYSTTLTPTTTASTDISQAVYANKSATYNFYNPRGLWFKPDGTHFYVLERNTAKIKDYTLSTAWDVSTASYSTEYTFTIYIGTGTSTQARNLWFNSTGTSLYVTHVTGVGEFSLSTAWDISTISYVTGSNFYVGGYETSTRGFTWRPDGTRMYVVGTTTATVYEWHFSTGFDFSTGTQSTAQASFSLASQASSPRDIHFNSDGTTMYITDSAGPIYEYSLSTAYDVTTASYSNNSLDVSSQDPNPRSIFFGGGNFYHSGDDNKIYQYDFSSAALALGTGSFASTDVGKRIQGNGGDVTLTSTAGAYDTTGGSAFTDSSAIASGSWSMRGLKSAGDADGLTLNSYPIGGFGLTSASYDNVSFSLATALNGASSPNLSFSTDGTKMYAYGDGYPDKYGVYQFTLSTPWSLSTASYDNVFLQTGAGNNSLQDNQPFALQFFPDGTGFFTSGNQNGKIYMYTLSTAFDLSTASYVGYNASFTSVISVAYDILFNDTGNRMYLLGNDQAIHQYSISSFSLASGITHLTSFSLTPQDSQPRSIDFNADGTKLYMVGSVTDEVHQYSLSTAYDVSTASYDSVSFSVGTQAGSARSLDFSTDGTKMYILQSPNVYQYNTQSTGAPILEYNIGITNSGGQINTEFWVDINSMTADQDVGGGTVHYAVSTDDRTTWSVAKGSDGVRPIVRDNSGTWQYNSENASTSTLDITGATYSGDANTFATNGQDTQSYTVAVKPDGTKIYVASYNSDSVYQYDLSTAFDLSTASYNNVNFSFSSQMSTPRNIQFKPDGSEMYLLDASNYTIYQYTMSTPWDLTTASYSYAAGTNDTTTTPRALAFKSDGTKMYITDASTTNQYVYKYDLSTAWRVDTATYSAGDGALNITAQFTNSANSVMFNPTGTKMHVYDYGTRNLYEYDLSTAWDISTGSYNNVYVSLDPQPSAAGYGQPASVHLDYTSGYLYAMRSERLFEWSGFTITSLPYSTTATWANATTNDEFYALQQALSLGNNRMDKAQLDAVADGSHFTLGDTLDLAIALRQDTASASTPASDGVSINYDAQALNQGAVLGTDYDYDFPDSTTVRVTSNAAQNLKVRVV